MIRSSCVASRLAALLLCLGLAPIARAGQLAPADVPAGVQWVIHVDVDAVRKSALWDIIDQKLKDNNEFQAGIGQIEQFTGMTFPRDLHEVTLYSSSFEEEDVVIVINADFQKDKIMQVLPHAQNYASEAHGKFDIMSWEDKGKRISGAFFTNTRIVLGRSKDVVGTALDTLAGQAQGMKADSPLAAAAKEQNALAYLAGKGLAELMRKKEPKNPLAGLIETAAISLGEKDNAATLAGIFTAKDAKTADQLRTSIEGLKAIAALAANNENADPKLKTLAPMVQNAKVTAAGETVDVRWNLPVAEVKALVEMGAAGRKPAEAPVTKHVVPPAGQ